MTLEVNLLSNTSLFICICCLSHGRRPLVVNYGITPLCWHVHLISIPWKSLSLHLLLGMFFSPLLYILKQMNAMIFTKFSGFSLLFSALKHPLLCVYILLKHVLFLLFWPINTMFKRIVKCHPNLIYFLKKKKKVHLGEWNEVLSCCSVSKLHFLCVKISCCSQD